MAAQELYSTSLFNDADLIHYYRLESNANDSKGSDNGTENSITHSTGKFGNGAYMDNVADYITFPYNFGLYDGRSISLWFYPTSNEASNRFIVMSNFNPDGWRVYINNLVVSIFSNFGSSASYTIGTANINEWNHLVLVKGSTAYLNNNKVTGSFVTGSDRSIRLGGGVFANDSMVGRYDDFAVFSRNLTDADVDLLYNGASSVRLLSSLGVGK